MLKNTVFINMPAFNFVELLFILLGIIIGVIIGVAIITAKHAKQASRLPIVHMEEIAKLKEAHSRQIVELKAAHVSKTTGLTAVHTRMIAELNAKHIVNIRKNRDDAVSISRNVLKGKISEHMAPLLSAFSSKYNLSEARFLGAPVDYIIFENIDASLEDGKLPPITITFADIKTGKAQLNKNQKRIQEAILQKRIKWDVVRIQNE